MAVRFLSEGIWKEITAAAKGRRGRAFVAVPYFGQSGSRLLPLRAGDTLLVNASEASVRSGQTFPRGLRILLNRGVDLYTLGNLHAKIYVLGSTAFIGSANASSNSRDVLEEAVVRVRDTELVGEARRHIQDLCKAPLYYSDLDRLEKLYRPPRRPGGNRKAGTSRRPAKDRYFIAQISEEDIEDECIEALAEGQGAARARRERRGTLIDEFWRNGEMPYRTGDMVIQVFKTKGGAMWVYPPGKIIYRHVVPRGRGFKTIAHLEYPNRPRRRLDTVQGKLARKDRRRIEKDSMVGNNQFRASLLAALR